MASFYMASDAIIERNGKYLMIKEGKDYVEGTWNIPGGGVEDGENPVKAVKREVFEETGLKVEEVEGLIGVMNGMSAKDGNPVIVNVFSCKVEKGEPEPEFDEEILDAEFLTLEEIKEKTLRNDIILRSIKMKENSEPLPTENFSGYKHPYLDEEP